MKTTLISLISLSLFIGTSSCKKQTSSASGSSKWTYSSSNNIVLNPNFDGNDSLRSIITLEKIDFLCDIENNRTSEYPSPEGYGLSESTVGPIRVLDFVMEERGAKAGHISLSQYLEESVLEIYHGQGEDIQIIGTCNSVLEVGLSYDRLVFEIRNEDLISYIETYPDYRLRVVNTFRKAVLEPRYFRYDLGVFSTVDYLYAPE